jgi:raffinose/stachyose/melibiose transport system permease protein
MILATMMAFALTRYRFKGRALINSLIISSLMFPAFSTIIPVFKMMTGLELLNKPISVILPQVAGNLSFATIIMMGFLRGLPIDMEEAAYMEGANVTSVFTRIIIPLSRPSLATVAIFCFLWSYNDLFTQLIMIRRRTKFPISALLNEISSKYGTDYGLMAASVTLIVIPVLIIYMFLQKNIIKGLTAGAVKG